MTKDELKCPASHLRACEIIEQAESLNEQAALEKASSKQPGGQELEPGGSNT